MFRHTPFRARVFASWNSMHCSLCQRFRVLYCALELTFIILDRCCCSSIFNIRQWISWGYYHPVLVKRGRELSAPRRTLLIDISRFRLRAKNLRTGIERIFLHDPLCLKSDVNCAASDAALSSISLLSESFLLTVTLFLRPL